MRTHETPNELTRDLRQCLSDELGLRLSGIGDAESLLTSQVIESLGMLKLVVAVEQRYGIRVEGDDLVPANFETLSALAQFIAHRTARAATPHTDR